MITRAQLSNPVSSLRFEAEGIGSSAEPNPDLADVFESIGEDGEDGEKYVKLSQSRLTKLALASKNKGATQAARAVAEQLGMSVEDAKKLIGEYQAQIDASKTETQREKDAAEKARKEADAEKSAIAAERHQLRIEKALLRAGADPQRVDRLSRLVDAEVGADEASILEAVELVKTEFASIFGSEEKAKGSAKLPSGAPAGQRPKAPPTEDAFERGKLRALSLPGAKKAI